jgi:ABC-type antimicrobial peptide transport system permease subunit
VNALNKVKGAEASVQSFDTVRPAEITNYESMGSVPLLLALTLALGAVVALVLTLLTSVRRRRRDLALLRALGLRSRQLASVIAWQSTSSVLVGVIFGVPLGIVLGRALWDLFAHELFAIPAPTVPVVATLVVALGALVLANVIAVIPARSAANTSTSEVLRAD